VLLLRHVLHVNKTADVEVLELRTRVLRVTDVLERLGGVLAGLREEHLVTTRVLRRSASRRTLDTCDIPLT